MTAGSSKGDYDRHILKIADTYYVLIHSQI